jgi:TatD DNase family protein
MRYFDTHAHYYDERFANETDESVDKLVDALFKNQLSYIINVGTSPDTSRLAVNQAKRHKNMYTAIGIHPSDCQFLDVSMGKALSDIEGLILDKASKCVALGEIGLDYHYDGTDREKQLAYFDAQMYMAKRLSLPVVIHDRDAHGDVFDMILRHPDVKGVLHSYSGSPEMALELCKRGYYISFSGTLTFTNARKVREVAALVPKDRILIETDCPYLAPHPLRGTLNHSGNLLYTNSTLAQVLGISEAMAASLTEKNAKTLFNIKD